MPLDSIEWYEAQADNARWIENKAEAWAFLHSLSIDDRRALDFETTSLFPWDGGVIRLTIITDDTGTVVIDHFKSLPFTDIADAIAMRKWAVYNAGFEGRWIDYHTEGGEYDSAVDLLDVQFLRKAKMGGGPSSLAIEAKKALKIDLDKAMQNSGWHQDVLSPEQKRYAAMDGVVTWAILQKWQAELSDGQIDGAFIMNDAWRGNVMMEMCGLQLDVTYHRKLLKLWTLKRDTAERYLRKFTPKSVINNLNSGAQVGKFIMSVLDDKSRAEWPLTGKKKEPATTREVLTVAANKAPYPFSRWLGALVVLNKMNKYISTYGEKLITKQEMSGKVSSRFNMAQAITCRYSSSDSNLQNIPNQPVVRRSFVTKDYPTSRDKIIIADYKSIEVRVLAEVSGDKMLLHDAIYGDVHSRSASAIFKIDFDEFTKVLKEKDPNDETRLNSKYDNIRPLYKSMRTRAKAFTFQLLYGAGFGALGIALRCSDEEAAHAVEAWAQTYPDAYHYRHVMFDHMERTGYLPVVDGRTIFVFRDERTIPVAANYPIQGAAASVMYRAIYHVERLIRERELYNTILAATVHDELLMYAKIYESEKALEVLEEGMKLGWLDIFPGTDTNNLADGAIGDTWADKS
jgi:DNA polymerase I-like protein with 3'-5' exonuclease and polymerase domains